MELRRADLVDGAGRRHMTILTATALAVLLLVAAGLGYRVAASDLIAATNTEVKLPVPLSDIPLRLDDWIGEELDIPQVTQDYIRTNFADDYVSRRYVDVSESVYADVYVVYCSSRPSGIVGHKPQVCFPGHGWVRDSTSPSELVTESGRSVKCLVHRFHRPAPSYQEVVVLNFYVLNGEITLNERDFAGFWGRRPNISGNPARYVAQVQISSVLEHPVRTVAARMVDVILAFLPDEDGRVGAAEMADEVAPAVGAADGDN